MPRLYLKLGNFGAACRQNFAVVVPPTLLLSIVIIMTWGLSVPWSDVPVEFARIALHLTAAHLVHHHLSHRPKDIIAVPWPIIL